MIKTLGIRRKLLRLMLLPGLLAVALTLLTLPPVALAHPLDVFLQATYLTIAPRQIIVELDLSPGVLVVPQLLPYLDPNGDQQISDAESQAYVNTVLQNIELQVDGLPLDIAVTKVDIPDYLTIQAGYAVIRIFAITNLADEMIQAQTHELYYKNNFAPAGSVYVVNAFVDNGVPITLDKQNRDEIQQSMNMGYFIGNIEPSTSATTNLETAWESSTDASDQVQMLVSYLNEPTLSPWTMLLAIGLAAVLGGIHALTPGHGKTLVAAYLVGSRGTIQHAILLGAIVTFTHTASVILIGLLALFASQFIVPTVLVPILEILSGLLVVMLGMRLVWQRWNVFRNPQRAMSNHIHPYGHSHTHNHDLDHIHEHDHGDGHLHSHLPPAEGIKLNNLLAMGISGGLLPCPEALAIMVIAVGVNRILLGMGLIVSFSFGLAAVLILIGILLVRSRVRFEQFSGFSNHWRNALPLISATIVTGLGIGIIFSGLVNYLR